MQYQNIKIKKEDKLFQIYINRPKQLNALNTKTINELYEAIIKAEKDKRRMSNRIKL